MHTSYFIRSFSASLFTAGLATIGSVTLPLQGQSTEQYRSWNQPREPFQIAENFFYVGVSDIASFLIKTPEGCILVDGGFVETAPLIRANLRKLGVAESDVKIILASHAHLDHAGGLAELRKVTGAKIYCLEKEAAAFERGGLRDAQWGDNIPFPAFKPDVTLADRGTVSLGGVTMTAHLTAGHTPGNATWTCQIPNKGQSLNIVIAGSIGASGYKLVNNAAYPEVVSDFRASFARLRSLPCDVFLTLHGSAYDLTAKTKRLAEDPTRNPFIDPQGYKQYVDKAEAALNKALAKR